MRADIYVYSKFYVKSAVLAPGEQPSAPGEQPPMDKYDTVFHIEQVRPDATSLSKRQLLMVNHEITFDDRVVGKAGSDKFGKIFSSITTFVCKTGEGESATRKLFPNRNVVMVGHTSPFRTVKPKAEDWNSFLHVAGSSKWKQTSSIVAAWQQHPEWPTLYITCAGKCAEFVLEKVGRLASTKNIHILQNPSNIYAVQCTIKNHLCPSVVEGYGHYINEARASGAFITASDLAPMNELVDSKCGHLIKCTSIIDKPHSQGARMCIIDVDTMVREINTVIKIPLEIRKMFASAARSRYTEDTKKFVDRFRKLAIGS